MTRIPVYFVLVGDVLVATATHRRRARRIARSFASRHAPVRVVKPDWFVIEF